MVEKHSTLRTIFADSASDALHDQVVVANGSGRITVTDLHDPSRDEDTGGILPWHFTITRVSETEILCELAINHALIDGASIRLLAIDLSHAVNDRDIGRETLSYSDYVAHVNSTVSKQSEYWKTYLHDATSCVFPKLNSSATEELHSEIRQIDSDRVRKFCEIYGFTLFNVFQVAWALILRYYANTDDVCFGYLVSGRDTPIQGIENAVGLFINTLICRLQLGNSVPILWILERNESNFIRSLEHPQK